MLGKLFMVKIAPSPFPPPFFLSFNISIVWSMTTLNYWMMVERYPNLKEEVGGLIPGCETSSILDINLPGGQLPHVLWQWLVGLMSQNIQINK